MKLTFLGDIALNDNYIDHYFSNLDPFEKISGEFRNADLIIGNLEVTCKGDDGFNKLKQPTLYTSEEALNYLNNLGVGFVSLANNHIYDNLKDGFLKTLNFLSQNGIGYSGAKGDSAISQYDPREIIELKGKKIALISYVHPETHPCLPENCDIHVSIYSVDKIVNHIKRLKGQVDLVILLLHWGLDNSSFPAPWQRKDAKTFIEAGADLIIGHHAHVIQGVETFNGKQVFYGLGNFCFSPFTLNAKKYDLDQRKHTKSIAIEIDLTRPSNYNIIPIKNSNDWISPGKESILTRFYMVSKLIPFVSNFLIWRLYVFYLSFIYKIYFFFFGNNRNPVDRLKTLNRKKINRFFTILKQVFTKK